MSDDTIRAALTLDALVEDVAETLWQRESVRATERPRRVPWADVDEPEKAKWRDTARAALAAVAKAAGGYNALRYGATCIDDTGNHSEPGQRFADDCAALLRTLAEAAP